MENFSDRLAIAVKHRGLEWSPTRLAEFFGVKKQTVDGWMNGSEPRGETLFMVADRLDVDARWLATGQGMMTPAPIVERLSREERALIHQYRTDSKWRQSVRFLGRALGKAGLAIVLALPFAFEPPEARAVVLHNEIQRESAPAPFFAKCMNAIHICARAVRRLFGRMAARILVAT